MGNTTRAIPYRPYTRNTTDFPAHLSDDPKHEQVNEASEFDECDQEINQSKAGSKIGSDPKVCLPNMLILKESQNIGNVNIINLLFLL